MKSYSVSYTQIHFTTLLRDLPFTVTRYGKPIAVFNRYNVAVRSDDKRLKENTDTVEHIYNKVSVKPFKSVCEHGSMLGLCKKGCK